MGLDLADLSLTLICPECKGPLRETPSGLLCQTEDLTFPVNSDGYLGFVSGRPDEGAGTSDDYAALQLQSADGPLERYVRPWLEQEEFSTLLDAGCGVGLGVSILASQGYDAFGVDLPDLCRRWSQVANDPNRFFAADVQRLPFPTGMFDAVWSFGVLEHIGTIDGFGVLSPSFEADRRQYASEILRVLKPGGRALIACPHKLFPIDIQHEPTGATSTAPHPARKWLWNKTGLNLHKSWGHYYLPTYREVERWFNRPVKPLTLNGYFGFSAFDRPSLKPLLLAANLYVDGLPTFLRRTAFNPYFLAEIRR